MPGAFLWPSASHELSCADFIIPSPKLNSPIGRGHMTKLAKHIPVALTVLSALFLLLLAVFANQTMRNGAGGEKAAVRTTASCCQALK